MIYQDSASSGEIFKTDVIRQLYPSEINLGRKVFGNTIPYHKIFIVKGIYSAPVTLATGNERSNTIYLFAWDHALKFNVSIGHHRSTLIHEMTHVWQSVHGILALQYLAGSFSAQIIEGFKEALKDYKEGALKSCLPDCYRNAAYVISMKDVGKPWSSFNTEQQAMLVETWFRQDPWPFPNEQIPGGNMSKSDPRYPYIKDNILAGNPYAAYFPYETHAIRNTV